MRRPEDLAARELKEAAAMIDTWRPRFPRPEDVDDIETLRPSVQKWVAATMPSTRKAALPQMLKVTRFALWGWRTTGCLREDVLFTPDNVEHFIHVVNAQKDVGWKNNERTALRRVARAVNPAGWPLKPPTNGPQPIKPPYAPSEEQTFLDVALLPGRRDRLARIAAVVCSLGAGMSAIEASLVRPKDVKEMPDGRLAVSVRGRRPRLVPIRRDCTPLAEEALKVAREAGADRFICCAECASNVAYRFMGDRRVDPNVETFSFRRARSTWLLAHLREGTPVPVLHKLAGPLSHRTLDTLSRLIADDLDPWQAAAKGMAA